MRIVVNHVTRMEASRVCVAGFDPRRLEHVRPTTLPTDPITRDLLREEGGAFGVGAVVELGNVVPDPSPPEVEDYRFSTDSVRHVEDMADDEFLGLLDEMRSPDLADAFGPELQRVGSWKYATERGRGNSSLAVIRAGRRPKLAIDDRYGKLQLRYDDVEPPTYVRVNDVRFYEADQKTVKLATVEDVSKRLRRGVGAYLMFGLTRAYLDDDGEHEHHWLQLNGLCMLDSPVGDIP